MNNGYKNEYDFVDYFDNKYYYELNKNSQEFLKDLFNDIDSETKIKSWKNKTNQKTDVFIKYKNFVKCISLKCGNSNSVHSESVNDFVEFLKKLKIPYKAIQNYLDYHYGYARDENGKLDFSKSLSADEYKILYQKEIDNFNKEIDKTKIIIEMIDRFIVRGKNADYDIDVLVSGTIDNYVWIKKYDLYELILSKRDFHYTSPHFCCITIGPKKRDLNKNSKNSKERYLIAVRWNFIRENIIEFKNKL